MYYQQDNGYSQVKEWLDICPNNQHTMILFSPCFFMIPQTQFVSPVGTVVLTVVLDSSQGVSRSHQDNALFITSYNNFTSNDERADGHKM